MTMSSNILHSQSIIMVVFREEKSVQDEVKAWDFWYSRQHSIKMRILDVGQYSITNF